MKKKTTAPEIDDMVVAELLRVRGVAGARRVEWLPTGDVLVTSFELGDSGRLMAAMRERGLAWAARKVPSAGIYWRFAVTVGGES